jgi:hypothetical protein
MSKSKLPEQVQQVKAILASEPSHPCFEIAQKLIDENPENISMWESLGRRRVNQDDLWVWHFLRSALRASALPRYHYMPLRDRNELSDRIDRLSKELSQALKTNDLDFHIIHTDGKIFNGFYAFEDFGVSNQERIEADGTNKLQISKLLKSVAERSKNIIAEEPLPGKAGINVKAIRFIRLMAKFNLNFYKTPLNMVLSTATNSIFGTNYTESDIRKLLSR